MFQNLSDKLSGVFDTLRKRGALRESDIDEALREIRRALLEADVNLLVVKSFISKARDKCLQASVIKSIQPTHLVIKIVHDLLTEFLGGKETDEKDNNTKNDPILRINVKPPAVILLAGLQGVGKTTTAAKLANYIQQTQKTKPLLVSLDTYRPAAQEQLQIIAKNNNIACLPIVANEAPLTIVNRALTAAQLSAHDVIIFDTAGRLQIDEDMMHEIERITLKTSPCETLLVADSMMGQEAAEIAKRFHERIKITGIILTRLDGDNRGGAALSMRSVTQVPIKFSGVGEKITDLEPFIAERIANRILGMGDIVSLVEKASAEMDQEESLRLAKRMEKGKFDLTDYKEQINQLQKMGGLASVMSLIPGMGKLKKSMGAMNIGDDAFKKQMAIINSCTPKEKRNPKLMNASRKKRVAAGSGCKVEEVNKLLKTHRQMADMMKNVNNKGGMAKMMQALGGNFGSGMPDMSQLAAMSHNQSNPLLHTAKNGDDINAIPSHIRNPDNTPLPGLGKKSFPSLGNLLKKNNKM